MFCNIATSRQQRHNATEVQMKKLLSIAVLAMGLSASIAHAQEPKANSQDAIAFQALESQAHADQSHYSAGAEKSTAKKSLLTKAFALGGSVQAQIENAKDNVKNSLSGELKDKFTSAKHAWDAGKAEWQSANVKQGSKAVTVSTDEKVEDHLRSSFY